MKPIAELTIEHGPIKLMLRILEKACERMETGEEMNRVDMENAITFIREFADKCHHGKEEKLLFPAMRENNIPEEITIIEALLEEHVAGRGFVKNMAEAVAENNTARFIENAKAYVALLNPHIDTENQTLFPMADKSLSEDKQNELATGFEDVEKNIIGEDRHAELHAIVHDFQKNYLR